MATISMYDRVECYMDMACDSMFAGVLAIMALSLIITVGRSLSQSANSTHWACLVCPVVVIHIPNMQHLMTIVLGNVQLLVCLNIVQRMRFGLQCMHSSSL